MRNNTIPCIARSNFFSTNDYRDIDDLVWVRFINTRPISTRMNIVSDKVFVYAKFRSGKDQALKAAFKWRKKELVRLLMENKLVLKKYYEPPPEVIHLNRRDNPACSNLTHRYPVHNIPSTRRNACTEHAANDRMCS